MDSSWYHLCRLKRLAYNERSDSHQHFRQGQTMVRLTQNTAKLLSNNLQLHSLRCMCCCVRFLWGSDGFRKVFASHAFWVLYFHSGVVAGSSIWIGCVKDWCSFTKSACLQGTPISPGTKRCFRHPVRCQNSEAQEFVSMSVYILCLALVDSLTCIGTNCWGTAMHSMSHGLVGPHLVAEAVHRTARFKPMPFGNLVTPASARGKRSPRSPLRWLSKRSQKSKQIKQRCANLVIWALIFKIQNNPSGSCHIRLRGGCWHMALPHPFGGHLL